MDFQFMIEFIIWLLPLQNRCSARLVLLGQLVDLAL